MSSFQQLLATDHSHDTCSLSLFGKTSIRDQNDGVEDLNAAVWPGGIQQRLSSKDGL